MDAIAQDDGSTDIEVVKYLETGSVHAPGKPLLFPSVSSLRRCSSRDSSDTRNLNSALLARKTRCVKISQQARDKSNLAFDRALSEVNRPSRPVAVSCNCSLTDCLRRLRSITERRTSNTEVCSVSVHPMEAMPWIKEVELANSVDDL